LTQHSISQRSISHSTHPRAMACQCSPRRRFGTARCSTCPRASATRRTPIASWGRWLAQHSIAQGRLRVSHVSWLLSPVYCDAMRCQVALAVVSPAGDPDRVMHSIWQSLRDGAPATPLPRRVDAPRTRSVRRLQACGMSTRCGRSRRAWWRGWARSATPRCTCAATSCSTRSESRARTRLLPSTQPC
jgi:hypothetical protein